MSVFTFKFARFLGKQIIWEMLVVYFILAYRLAKSLIFLNTSLFCSIFLAFLNYLTTFSTYSIFRELFTFLLILLKQF